MMGDYMDHELEPRVNALIGNKIKAIELFTYLGNLCIEQIELEDGKILELSGSCGNCNIDEVIEK